MPLKNNIFARKTFTKSKSDFQFAHVKQKRLAFIPNRSYENCQQPQQHQTHHDHVHARQNVKVITKTKENDQTNKTKQERKKLYIYTYSHNSPQF